MQTLLRFTLVLVIVAFASTARAQQAQACYVGEDYQGGPPKSCNKESSHLS